jgi:biotin carboxyl carrier protein
MLENAGTAARRKIEDRLQPPLEDAAQSALDSLLTLHGPLILATAEGRELSDEADRMRLTREEQATLRADAQTMARALHQNSEIIEPPAAEIVTKAAEAMNEGSHPERGTVFGLATMKNVTITLVGVAAVSAAFGMNVVEAGATLLTVEAVKKSETFSAVTSMLGHNIDRMLRVGAAYRRFVIANQAPLRQIADNTGQSTWMQPHIDRIVQAGVANQPDTPAVPPP